MRRAPYLKRLESSKVADWIYRVMVAGQSRQELKREEISASGEQSYAAEWLALVSASCPSDIDPQHWLDTVHRLMLTSLPNLSREMAGELVEAIAGSQCDALQTPDISAWMGIYRAIAGRDGIAMARTASGLLESEIESVEIQT